VLKVFGFVLGIAAFLALMLYVTSWSVRGWVAVAQWDGKSPLECFGSSVMTVRGRAVTTSDAAQAIMHAAGNCELEIIDCDLSGPVVLEAGGNAHVTVRNTKLNGGLDVAGNVQLDLHATSVTVALPARAMVSGNARVAFHNSRLEGDLTHDGNSVVTGIPEIDRQQTLVDLSRRYGAQACDGVVACYEKNRAFGNISGRLVVTIDASGSARDAHYENGDAPPAVRDCLIALSLTRKIEPFDGKPGQMICDYAGSFIPGAMRLSTSPSFVQGDPAAP
jgi:hypothetical protein